MKILAHIHAYPPKHNAGAEWMQHAMFKWLVAKGHECHVLTTVPENYELDGVKVYQDDFDNSVREWRWCDIGFTHLIRAGKAWNWSQYAEKPIIYTVHNTFTNRLVEIKTDFALLYNTDWAAADGILKGYKHPSMILHPPVWFDDYHTESKKRKYITLINCWDRKGGNILIELAKAMPDRLFLGVKGGYGEQMIADYDNLIYIENTPDIKSVYEKTRILIMPSVYESFGRTAAEAMCSGIPVIASATPGLKESLQDCGLFTPEVQDSSELKVQPFIDHINALDDAEFYREMSEKGLARAKSLDAHSEQQMQDLAVWMERFIKFKKENSPILHVWN